MTQASDVDTLQANVRGDVSNRAARLKETTHETHDRLDKSIMAYRPFESQARYGLFLKVQHQFHREIDGLYSNALLDRLLPDLAGRRRLGLIEQDLADLGMAAPASETAPTLQCRRGPSDRTWMALCGGRIQSRRGLSSKGGARTRAFRNLRRASSCGGAGRARFTLEDLHYRAERCEPDCVRRRTCHDRRARCLRACPGIGERVLCRLIRDLFSVANRRVTCKPLEDTKIASGLTSILQ